MGHRRVFQLTGLPKDPFQGTLITPEPVSVKAVQIAWTHAVRFTAKGIDIADYPSAVTAMLALHPTWVFIPEHPLLIGIDLNIKEPDSAS